jgi:hypothetical protein
VRRRDEAQLAAAMAGCHFCACYVSADGSNGIAGCAKTTTTKSGDVKTEKENVK